MTQTDLLMTGLEICGSYSCSNSWTSDYIFNLFPLTTANKIRAYLNGLKISNKNISGIDSAQKTASLLIDNVASPWEALLYIKLSTPTILGGYGIKNLKANERIMLSSKAREILKYPSIRPDLCNKGKKVAIEYDSNAFHDNTQQNEKDKIRADALQHDGWKLFTFVPRQLRDVCSFNNMAIQILKANGQEPRIKTKNFEQKRKALWYCLSKYYSQ